MGAIATILTLLTVAPSGTDAGSKVRLLVTPVDALGLDPAASSRLGRLLLDALRVGGARVATDRQLTIACSTDPVCARQKAKVIRADGLVAVTALRVGPSVQLTFRVMATPRGELAIDESLSVDAKGFPARDLFDPLVQRLLEVLAPASAAITEVEVVPDESSPTALSAAPAPVEPGPAESPLLGRWIGLGASAACVASGVTLLLLARADVARVEDARSGSSWREVEAAYERAPVLFGAGWAMTGLGVAGGIASLLWLPLGETQVAVSAGPSLAGIVVAGQF